LKEAVEHSSFRSVSNQFQTLGVATEYV